MSPGPRANLRSVLPAVIVISIIAIGLGGSYYLTAQAARKDAAEWHINPLLITFSADQGSGSAKDSFTCRPSIGPVTLEAISSDPSRVVLSVDPTSFPNCGSPPDRVVVTASCADQSSQNGVSGDDESCEGSFTGQVIVRSPTPYNNVPAALEVQITVTEN